MTDEGTNGIDVHVANDGVLPLAATLRVALYRDLELKTDEAMEELELPPHGHASRNVEGLLGRFVDVNWAYRFGPPVHDAVVASLEAADGSLLSQAFRFPLGRPIAEQTAEELGLVARLEGSTVQLESRRVVHGIRLHLSGARAADDAFSLEPGRARVVALDRAPAEARLTALNLDQPLVL